MNSSALQTHRMHAAVVLLRMLGRQLGWEHLCLQRKLQALRVGARQGVLVHNMSQRCALQQTCSSGSLASSWESKGRACPSCVPAWHSAAASYKRRRVAGLECGQIGAYGRALQGLLCNDVASKNIAARASE